MILFFFKQKTAYEMRISDWSSDVCSSDLAAIISLDMVLDPHDQVDVGAFAGEAGASVPTADDVFEPGREQRRPRPPLPIGIDQAHVGTWFPWRPPNEQGQGRAHHRREIALRNPAHIDKGAGNPATRVRARSEEHTSELQS